MNFKLFLHDKFTLVRFLLFQCKSSLFYHIRECSDQILTFVKIVTRVSPHQGHLKWTEKLDMSASPLRIQEDGLRPYPESTFDLRSLSDICNCQVSLRLYLFGITWIFNSEGIISLIGGLDPTANALREDSHLHTGYYSATGFPNSQSQLRCQIILTF